METYKIEEYPKDLEFVCNHEQGQYTLFKSKSTGELFAVFKTLDFKGNPIISFKKLENPNPYYPIDEEN